MVKLVFFVPESSVDDVKDAVFAAGGGQLGDYSQCSWQVLGKGQFLPGMGSQPAVGVRGNLEVLREYRVEMLCKEDKLREVVAALKRAHPYEEPAYDVTQLVDI